ncbi:HAD family hydrolase [Bacillus wiedmannii]|uniref:HAD family hydrolase n=1 Tax=Bacillus wiedmannii TaxID=1890302 RepID=UPI00086C19F2|nr:HAD family hydrolase [Bacillus wiedmannii]SCN41960.1 HAD hydrolase, family IA [Bacillus wiedmannii]
MKAIIFDLDETLISHRKQLENYIDYQYNHFYKKLKGIPFEEWKNKFIDLDQNGYVTKDIVYRELVNIYNIELSQNQLYEHFLRNFHNYVSPLQGANELLFTIKDCNLKLGLLTNGGTTIQENKIKRLKYENIFDEIVISESVGYEKPNPYIFNLMLEKLEVEAKDCLYVGDHVINDIKGAKDLGFKTIWMSHNRVWEDETYVPDWIANNLREVRGIVINEVEKYKSIMV